MIYLGGLDIGTTGCKISVYDEKGNYICNHYCEYPSKRDSSGHEIDCALILQSVKEVLKEAAKQYKLEAVGVASFGETFAMLDENDNILYPGLLYTDHRGDEEINEFAQKFGEDKLTYITGVKVHSMYGLAKMLWLKKHEAQVFSKVKHILQITDFICYCLTGNAVIDYSLASRSQCFDIRNKCWSDEILNMAGIDKNLLSKPVRTGTVAGEIKESICSELGIEAGIKIVCGCQDQIAAALGCGILESGNAVDGTGTVECITPVFDSVPENKEIYEDRYSVVPYAVDGTYVCYAVSYTGGASIKWFRDNVSAEKSYKVLDSLVKDEPSGILVMPHFAGSGNPTMDIHSKAAFIGLTLEHNNIDIYKAIMEGVTYDMLVCLEGLEKAGIVPEKLYATGGGAASSVWLQIKADILNRPICTLKAKEAGACGICMLAGTAIGLYKDLHQAKSVFVKEDKVFTPNPEMAKKYAKLYNAYRQLYTALTPVREAMI